MTEDESDSQGGEVKLEYDYDPDSDEGCGNPLARRFPIASMGLVRVRRRYDDKPVLIIFALN